MPETPPAFPPDATDAPRCHALVPSAGSGSRAGTATPKQYRRVAGARLIDHTVRALLAVPGLAGVAVVVAPDDDTYQSPDVRVRVWPVGGASRAHSVCNGLAALAHAGARPHDWVLVHDAARCLVDPADVARLIDACQGDPVGGLLGLPLPDTLKAADAAQRVCATVDRADKWLAQTPQMFRLGALRQALEAHRATGFAGITDEASAIEAAGLRPRLVRGSAHNLKVTYPEDFALAEAVLRHRAGAHPSEISA
ncbi:2-C-methyl-D-erythritol 4-phosphate cytidylyltransferase [Aquabacterium sp. A08]|uniref:2-C-methyl-D-erythritol 4-phosphate cytidylyltransferase n=1 Tax=Aquabacterium sp. A08 TaxID=2718532 RepID=UPI00142408F5|nr:2-C-methyl-D-erythritol 4-phosphate cytidylyltransferase [Aquabacterium sp. A08]NIC40644.1 2-C-methyl-D-erythritol 4-phosphate cytidylyltransferase [Aquabacterium sp. A08]